MERGLCLRKQYFTRTELITMVMLNSLPEGNC